MSNHPRTPPSQNAPQSFSQRLVPQNNPPWPLPLPSLAQSHLQGPPFDPRVGQMDNPHGRQPQGALVGPHAPADYDLALQKEKTQQEHLKLERIRTTKDILETCLNRGVPPTPWVAGDPELNLHNEVVAGSSQTFTEARFPVQGQGQVPRTSEAPWPIAPSAQFEQWQPNEKIKKRQRPNMNPDWPKLGRKGTQTSVSSNDAGALAESEQPPQRTQEDRRETL